MPSSEKCVKLLGTCDKNTPTHKAKRMSLQQHRLLKSPGSRARSASQKTSEMATARSELPVRAKPKAKQAPVSHYLSGSQGCLLRSMPAQAPHTPSSSVLLPQASCLKEDDCCSQLPLVFICQQELLGGMLTSLIASSCKAPGCWR